MRCLSLHVMDDGEFAMQAQVMADQMLQMMVLSCKTGQALLQHTSPGATVLPMAVHSHADTIRCVWSATGDQLLAHVAYGEARRHAQDLHVCTVVLGLA